MSRPLLVDRVAQARIAREARDGLRRHRMVTRRDGVRYEVDGRWLLNFCSNDYLGLSTHFTVVGALQDGSSRDGAGSGASALVCGYDMVHRDLERAVADWLDAPAALLFSSGYMANLAVMQTLLGNGDVCVQDKLNHASLIDAARLAGCHLRRYPHGDGEAALQQLKAMPMGAAMIATDGVFSMDGDIAPLRVLALAAKVQKATLYVDDAHGVGVLGPQGRGSVAAAQLAVRDVPLQLVTLGKALGVGGALVVGDDVLIDHLAETARSHVYSTSLPPALAAAALESVRIARRDDWRRERLQSLVQRLREGARREGLALLPSDTPIQPLLLGGAAEALAMSEALEERGVWVTAIRPPSVPENTARLRITLTAAHSDTDIDILVRTLCQARDSLPA